MAEITNIVDTDAFLAIISLALASYGRSQAYFDAAEGITIIRFWDRYVGSLHI